MNLLLVAAAAAAAEVVATVHGTPITRTDLERALTESQRQAWHDATADLEDAEHAAVRDFLGRQAVQREAVQRHAPADSIYARVLASDFDRFDPNLRNRIQQQRERVFGVERAALESVVQKRLFESAARARGMSPEQLTRALADQVPPVTASDLAFIKAYEASKDEATATVAPGEQRLEAAIRNARLEQLRMAVIDSLRTRDVVQSRLAPPRVVVSAGRAPIVGSPTAPIQIVVFTDFECPYCLESEQTLTRLRERYADRIAIRYLNYPLPSHAYARPAAVAAMCAAAQGKYLAFHDLLFAHQQELAHLDYLALAQQAGLDRAAFAACRVSGEADRRVDDDIREGIAAGVAGTPTFLVNGRLVTDNERLTAVVAEEAASVH